MRLRHLGDGKFEVTTAYQRQHCNAKFKSDDEIVCSLTKARSNKQSRALFAAIRKAWDNQRENRWEDPEHLRADAFCTVGHKTSIYYELPADVEPTRKEFRRLEILVSDIVRRHHRSEDFVFVRRTGERGIAIDTPRSCAFERTEHEAATAVFDAVLDFLVEKVCPGITREQLLEAVKKDPT